jgi:glycosyltransferase involved in cell wall biosynthesis
MRILFHHRTLGDGAEGIHIEAMVTAFRHLGHEVEVCGPARTGASASGAIHWVRAALPERIVQAAVLGYNVSDYLHIRRTIERIRPHFIYKRHARYDVAALTAARAYALPTMLEVNAVYSAAPYRDFEPSLMQPLAQAFERRALRLASEVIAVSTPMARQVLAVAGRSAFVVPNGVDPERFAPARANPARIRQKYSIGERPVIGWCGILREWHGLELLLGAAEALPDVFLLVVGEGPQRAALEREATSRNLADRLAITGRVDHDEIPDYIATFDIAVIAHDRTGVASPMKLPEYMAMSRAIVAPKLENMTELLDDGSTGCLFQPDCPDDLLRVISSLVADPRRRATLGRAARDIAMRERSWRKNAEFVAERMQVHVEARRAS